MARKKKYRAQSFIPSILRQRIRSEISEKLGAFVASFAHVSLPSSVCLFSRAHVASLASVYRFYLMLTTSLARLSLQSRSCLLFSRASVSSLTPTTLLARVYSFPRMLMTSLARKLLLAQATLRERGN